MNRTRLLQEIRKMRFEEAYGGWQPGQLTQEEDARRLGGVCMAVPAASGSLGGGPCGADRLATRRGWKVTDNGLGAGTSDPSLPGTARTAAYAAPPG